MSLQDVLSTLQVDPIEGELVDERVARRIEHCGRLSRNAAQRCMELLVSALDDTEGDEELLEDLVLLGLAWPKLVVRYGFELAAGARRLAERRLLDGDAERARALRARALELFPSHRGLEHDLIAVLRQVDDVEALARRCMARAQAEIDAGRPLDAVPWLQQVLAADPGRRDVARLIRDLRFRVEDRRRRRRRAARTALLGAALVVVGGAIGWRELDLRRQHDALPPADLGSAASVEVRLAALDAFASAHPYWHGTLDVRAEQSELRVTLARLESRAELDRERRAEEERRRTAEAGALMRGLETRVALGELGQAIRDVEQALELGGPQWPLRERALADLEAIRALRAESGTDPGEQR